MADFSSYGGKSAEWLAIEKTLPAGPQETNIPKFRDDTNATREQLAKQEMIALAPRVVIKEYSIPTRDGDHVGARLYIPKELADTTDLPLYIHLHGGGFLFGSLDSEDSIATRIALEAQVVVLHVNYRHTPEHVYPAAWYDVQDAFQWVHENIETLHGNPSQVLVGGVSAGAWLTASLVLQQHLGKLKTTLPPIVGQVLMIPALVHESLYSKIEAQLASPSKSSKVQNADAPLLPKERSKLFNDLLDVKDPEGEGLLLSPGNASPEEVKGLPPTVFGIAGQDQLRDEGLLFAKMLTEVGVPTDVTVFKGLPHGFRRFGDRLSASKHWDQVMSGGIKWALSKPSPSKEFVIKEG